MIPSKKLSISHSRSKSLKPIMPDSIMNKGFLYSSHINKHRNLRQISTAGHRVSGSIDESPNYLLNSMINKVEIMVDEYQKVRNIESKSSQRAEHKHTKHRPLVSSPSHFSIIEQLSRKLKEDKAPITTSYLASARFKQSGESFEKVGPGSYKVDFSGSVKSPAYRFPSANRMDNSFEHKLAGKLYTEYNIFFKTTDFESKTIDFIDKNKTTQSFTKESNLTNLKRKARVRTAKAEKAIETKRKYFQSKMLTKRENLEDKFRKYEWRIKREEFMQVKQTWWKTIMIHGISTISLNKIRRYNVISIQNYKQRLSIMLGVIKVTIKALVIFKKSLMKIRTKIAIRMLAPFRKYVQSWVRNKRAKFREVLADKFEHLEMGYLLFKVIATWKFNVIIDIGLKNPKKHTSIPGNSKSSKNGANATMG